MTRRARHLPILRRRPLLQGLFDSAEVLDGLGLGVKEVVGTSSYIERGPAEHLAHLESLELGESGVVRGGITLQRA